MTEMQGDLEDIRQVAEELIFVMDNQKIEKQLLEDCVREWQKILEIREIQKTQAKNVIQDIIAIKSFEEENYKKTEVACEQINHEGQALEKMVSQKRQELDTVQSECTKLQGKLVACQTEAQQLELQKQEVAKQKQISIPRTRYDISLYKLITNLHWELDTPPNEIRGYVHGNTEVKPFSYNIAQKSKFDICNTLWNKIAEESQDW